ncbi:MAG: hypothetical protein HOE90_23880 [Bacteriovoracaceae bacterium]|jgi:N-acetylmuramic acid 6-phosphate etherase|nr:hypothetical protein [Bacteriovoracaceae bacterium]
MGLIVTLKEFLELKDQFSLGDLMTESFHPDSKNLSTLSNENLTQAIEVLNQIDIKALGQLKDKLQDLKPLQKEIGATLEGGGNIYLCGCGATGRLSLTLEEIWKKSSPDKDRVRAFMAGGDVAMVRSVEHFEDNPQFGADHLKELGFCDGDLLIGITEGGETSFVIGATEHASKNSHRKPYFVYCNPTKDLVNTAIRSKEIIENANVNEVCLSCGPMAISGSTRMQASTIQMLAVGLCLFETTDLDLQFNGFMNFFESMRAPKFLASFIESEAREYDSGNYIEYISNELGIVVLTDTTERSPTFGLPAFESYHAGSGDILSHCYFSNSADDSLKAWRKILGRDPYPLMWDDTVELTGMERLLSFDFGLTGKEKRQKRVSGGQKEFLVDKHRDSIKLQFNEISHDIELETDNKLFYYSLLKTILNIHSTLVMGRMGRYQGNIMTWVKPANLKLIDRAIRYTCQILVQNYDLDPGYNEVAKVLFELAKNRTPDESIVLKIIAFFTAAK